MTRHKLSTALVGLVILLTMTAVVRSQDSTTILAQFLSDLRAGTLGVAFPLTTVTTTGLIDGGNARVTAGGNYSWNGRNLMRSSANGLFNVGQNSGATPQVSMNTGTAQPTVASCGTGTVDAKSTNVAGRITPTGAMACTVTFGLPNWTNTPFCIVTFETVAEVNRISAISTTAFTVTFATAANVFDYVCLGGL